MPSPIGQKLKAAREQQGLSLLDAAHATRIPVQRLHFLEQDNYAGFGSMTYARAFLRQYSEFLGVNAHEMLSELPGGVLGGPRDYRYLTDTHGLWVAPRGQRVGRLSSPNPRKHSRRSPVPAGIFIFMLVLVVLIAMVLFSSVMYYAERGAWDGGLHEWVNDDGATML